MTSRNFFRMTSIVVLMGCVAFVSCDRAQQMVHPVLPNADVRAPSEMREMNDPALTGPSIVINELMADNDNTVVDSQGDYDDWLELHNLTDTPVLLTGMYLSDKADEPTKWAFPENTEIPANGYLVVWLDDDEGASEGLHANFKLSKNGETAMLVDTDARDNQVLDSIAFGEQGTDVAFGRWPDGTGDFQVVLATPGTENKIEYPTQRIADNGAE